MTADRFEASFQLQVERPLAWRRLTENSIDPRDGADRYWLPGFDGEATVVESADQTTLRLTKDEEPCAGTDIVVQLTDGENGTRITVVQSGFGDWMPPFFDVMAVGWRHIVADLQAYLSTGVHAHRHVRPWGDLGAEFFAESGGLRITAVRSDTLAARLGLVENDLLTVLADAPVSSHDDIVTVLRVLAGRTGEVSAEYIRDDALVHDTTAAG